MDKLINILESNKIQLAHILPFELENENVYRLDLSIHNSELYDFDILDSNLLNDYIEKKCLENNALIAIGGYGEERLMYTRSPHFGMGEEARSIHLGIDIWCVPNTPVFAPLDGKIHSFRDNDKEADYGPTILLEHVIDECKLFSLYGHLNRRSLKGLVAGKRIGAGEKFAEIGNYDENGHWPPHLHFQLIRDIKGMYGDFPGVASKKEREKYLQLCPDPHLLIKS